MSADKLARIRWSLGQTLLPQHLELQEEAFTAEARLASRLRGLPVHGVARLSWNAQLLKQGELALAALTVVFQDGRTVDVPSNAVVTSLDLRQAPTNQLAVYLHLMSETTTGREIRLYADDPSQVERVIHCLRLSLEPTLPGTQATLKLVELKREPNSAWAASKTYSPPLLLVGTSPFLRPLLTTLSELVTGFRREVLAHLSDAYVARDRAAAVRRMLVELQVVEAHLNDLEAGVHPHPYELFTSMRRLYFEACCFNEVEPEPALPTYMHEAPAVMFAKLIALFKHQVRRVRPRLRYCAFERKGSALIINPLAEELRNAQEVYLLVQRPDIRNAISLTGIKLASPGRLPTVHRLSLRGVPLDAVKQLDFPHSFGADIDFYRVRMDEEWQQVLREGAVAFYGLPELARASFSLFWRA